MTTFWKQIAASLPPEVRVRYARDLEAAERFEHVIDLAIETWNRARRVLGRCCEALAQGLRRTARLFDSAARQLWQG
jgi:hypothetical protein